MCAKHYAAWRRSRLPECLVDGCPRRQNARGYCTMHYERHRKAGDVGTAEPLVARGTRRSMTTDGYVRLHLPDHPLAGRDGWVLEHRAVAFEHGLLTGPTDRRHVHHRDETKTNNVVTNLEVLTPRRHANIHAHDKRLDPAPYVAMRDAGMSLPAISAATGTNTGTIHRVIARWRRDHPNRKGEGYDTDDEGG